MPLLVAALVATFGGCLDAGGLAERVAAAQTAGPSPLGAPIPERSTAASPHALPLEPASPSSATDDCESLSEAKLDGPACAKLLAASVSGNATAHGPMFFGGGSRVGPCMVEDMLDCVGRTTAPGVAVSATGNATAGGDLCTRLARGDATPVCPVARGGAAVSGTGDAAANETRPACDYAICVVDGGGVAVSGTGHAEGSLLAVSGTGDAEGGLVALSATGSAEGDIAFGGCSILVAVGTQDSC